MLGKIVRFAGMERIHKKNKPKINMLNSSTQGFFSKADVSGSVSFIMFKVSGGKKVHEFRLASISEHHAITVAENFYKTNGLIGRYYCETENGKMFQINW
jgi:hypothetical protein